MPELYYYIDVDLSDLRVLEHGVSETAHHTGDTDAPHVHRVFLTKGQYNKLAKKLRDLPQV